MNALRRLTTTHPWYTSRAVAPRVTLVQEPGVHALLQSSMWHLQGDASDLLIDTGLGVRPLRVEFPELLSPDCILVMTHGHLDHTGSAPEFRHRWGHSDEPFGPTRAATLRTSELEAAFEMPPGTLGVPEKWLLSRLPETGFDPASYVLPDAALTRHLRDGDTIDLGDLVLEVLHLPGHTPGSIALWWESAGYLFTGDVIYEDDALLADLPESSPGDYARSLRRLRTIPAVKYFPGHGDPFDRETFDELLARFLPQLDELASRDSARRRN